MPIPRGNFGCPASKEYSCHCLWQRQKAIRCPPACRLQKRRWPSSSGERPTIGHIVDGSYVPIAKSAPQDVSFSPIDLKDWASVVLCDQLFKSIQNELFAVYSQRDAMKIYCISLLRVCDKGIRDFELKEAYEN